MADVLVVDDDSSSRETIKEVLERAGHRVAGARGGSDALGQIRTGNYDLVVTDLVMPTVDGLEILDAVKKKDPSVEVILLTGYGSVETAVDAMKRGAYQYLNKPINIKELREVARKALEKQSLARDNVQLKKAVKERFGFESIIGNSDVMKRVFEQVRQVAPTSATVLVTGASGSGKELIAHAIHNHSPRSERPFMAFNCGALTETLIESELFGHEKGAFTGAISDRKGYFELADGGTLFLDEIGEMPLHLQVKLLRVLETHSFFRVGGVKKIEVDVRIIAATNRKLEEMIAEGRFREDLYFRLKVLSIDVPKLSERRDDIPLLAGAFLAEMKKRHNRPIKGFTSEAMERLVNYTWPGNVRELRNLIENLVITTTGEEIDVEHLPSSVAGDVPISRGGFSFPEGMTMDEIEKAAIRIALKRSDGHKKNAAASLGMSLRTFHRKAKAIEEEER